ncbi:MAG TPA: LLM class F420-dependent oxidoreductase [Thermomicrobiales bacterium]|jgi:F420-dependent oxidoreductase-like protein|nr:LLM class F420-dependent oxidoreductase [Thermomicrobiales bacterium]
MATMTFGSFVPQGWRMDLTAIEDPVEQFEAMTGVARAADAGPWDSIWVYDHFHTVPQPTMNTVFESWTISATLARDTERVKVGQMVNCHGYRNPALFAKIASTVDVASHGRLLAGYGAGWYEHEWKAYGYGFPETRDRMRAFREGVQILHRMWTEDKPTFDGQYHHIHEPINEPKSARPGRKIPLWIGGGGEQVTLKLVAQYGDATNVGIGDPEVIRHKFDVLRGHCEAVGRNYDEIVHSTEYYVYPVQPGADPVVATARLRETMGNMSYEDFAKAHHVGTVDDLAELVRSGQDAGVDYAIVYIPGLAYDQEPMRMFEEGVIARFA